MRMQGSKRRGGTAILLGGLVAPLAIALLATAQPAESIKNPASVPPIKGVAVLGLAELEKLALERQPAIHAYEASLAAATAKLDALNHLILAGVVRHDLPLRKKQAELGIVSAEAALHQIKGITLYSVRRNFWSIVYARQQKGEADRALEKTDPPLASLRGIRDAIGVLKPDDRRRDIRPEHIDRLDGLLAFIEGRRAEAEHGIERAAAALREAVGLEPFCPLDLVTPAELPTPVCSLSCEELVKLAISRREEIVQVNVGHEVVGLEVEAQCKLLGPSAETFASGSDLHADPVVRGSYDGSYRPGGVTIEMPTRLYGQKKDRVQQAELLHDRSAAVIDKARQLITLEALDTYHRWCIASRQAERFQVATKKYEDAARALRDPEKGFKPTVVTSPSLSELIDTNYRAAQSRLDTTEARYNALLALISLERITAGGFCADFGK